MNDDMPLAAVNTGETDAAPALQQLLSAGGEVAIPGGTYLLGQTLRVPSGTTVTAAPDALFRLADGAGRDCHSFLIANANPGNGNQHISLSGGIWDGNCAGNPRGPDGNLFSYSGVAISFVNVEHLTVRNLTVRNPESFSIRVGEVTRFQIEDITLDHPLPRPNRDGVHVGGYSSHGTIRRIRATGPLTPNDDMVALNADDDVERQLNLGMRRGPISHLLIEDIEAEDAYTFVRLLSVTQPIEHITLRRLRGMCRVHGVNLNNWRFPKGVGVIHHIHFDDCELGKSRCEPWCTAIWDITLAVDELLITNFRRHPDTFPAVHTLMLDNHRDQHVELDGRVLPCTAESGLRLVAGNIDHLHIRRTATSETLHG